MLDDQAREEFESEIADKKRAAYEIVADAMADAEAEGIERDIVTQAALFAVMTDLVSRYGESAVAGLAEKLQDRVLGGEFTLSRTVQ
jgi:hypothetical protein